MSETDLEAALDEAEWSAKTVAAEVTKEIARTDLTPDDLVDVLHAQRRIERLRADLKTTLDRLSEHGADLMVSRKQFVEGIGEIERQGGTDRSAWDHDRLFQIALARGRDDPARYDLETGEMLIPEGEAVLAEIRAMAGTPGYWKVGALRDRGLDPADYCNEKDARRRVKLPKDDRTDEA